MKRALALMLLAAASATAQMIHSDSRLVVVDAVITDKKGAPIAGLAQSDFKVLEDGKPQVISAFSPQLDAHDQNNNLVFLFDDSTVAPASQRYARDAADHFIESGAGPNRRISIVDFNGTLRVTQNFTSDIARLKRALNVPEAGGSTRTITRPLLELAGGLANVPGRKTLVLFSSGFSAPGEDLTSAADAFNHANVAVYAVDIRLGKVDRTTIAAPLNLRSEAGRPDQTEVRVQNPADALYVLARSTGGFVISGANALPAGLDEIGREQARHYVLGYVPAAALKPGTCHALKVKVDHPGATVRARSSYCETSEPEVLTGTPTQRDLEARLSAGTTPNVHATIQTPFFYTPDNLARVYVAIDIPAEALRTKLNVVGVAYRPEGDVAARFSDTVNLAPQDLASGTYHYQTQFEAPAGKLDLKVAFSSSADRFGSLETPMNIDPWIPSRLSLSGLAWSTSAHPAATQNAGLFGDKVSLAFNGAELIPAGTNRFHKNQKVYMYAEIYEPSHDDSLSEQVILLDAGSGKIAQDSGMTPVHRRPEAGNTPVPLGLIVPVDELPAGSYFAQVNVVDGTGNRATRSIHFELTP